ncbi:MAG: hypothetical protein NZ826_06490 [Thermodesulfovibrio sp.]|nr:hypothetical protein [Thermodesulfovibrio sp.]
MKETTLFVRGGQIIESDKGYCIKLPHFGIISSRQQEKINIDPEATYKLELLKYIIDKRGKQVPIYRIAEKHYCTCGECHICGQFSPHDYTIKYVPVSRDDERCLKIKTCSKCGVECKEYTPHIFRSSDVGYETCIRCGYKRIKKDFSEEDISIMNKLKVEDEVEIKILDYLGIKQQVLVIYAELLKRKEELEKLREEMKRREEEHSSRWRRLREETRLYYTQSMLPQDKPSPPITCYGKRLKEIFDSIGVKYILLLGKCLKGMTDAFIVGENMRFYENKEYCYDEYYYVDSYLEGSPLIMVELEKLPEFPELKEKLANLQKEYKDSVDKLESIQETLEIGFLYYIDVEKELNKWLQATYPKIQKAFLMLQEMGSTRCRSLQDFVKRVGKLLTKE